MKVLHIFKTYFPDTQGGLEEAIRQISEYTSSKGVKNRIITVSPDPIPQRIGFKEGEVIRYKTTLDIFSTPISLSFISNCQNEINNSDIVHYHYPWPFTELSYVFQKIKKPVLLTYHADILKYGMLKFFLKPFINRFLSSVDRIIPTSQSFLDSSKDLQPFKKKCRVINLSIGKDRFDRETQDGEGQSRKLSEIKSKYGENFFLFVGVLRDYKGLEYLVRAMDGVNQNLVIIGKGKNKDKLKKLAHELGNENVFFPGYVEDKDLYAFFKLCRAFVLPSIDRSEAFGVSLLEASLCSKPMISTELLTGTSYVNKHMETGLVVTPKNIQALKEAILKLAGDDALCTEFGENARKRYERKFVPEITGKQYMDVYKELLFFYKKS